MNTDRELLELAAKAAGYEIIHLYRSNGILIKGRRLAWDPLNDDGDAFRLAVRLAVKLSLQMFPDDMGDRSVSLVQDNNDKIVCAEKYQDDGRSATRRAIVRCAANIGEFMS